MPVVTLHVSVWVEMASSKTLAAFWKSRSTWACELKFACDYSIPCYLVSRSTWACELKWKTSRSMGFWGDVTLHVSVWVEIYPRKWHENGSVVSRSTWACELKCNIFTIYCLSLSGHAPRERVSWNKVNICKICKYSVTLHVSVWVEIDSAML